MLCCVIGGAFAALLIARLGRLPVLGPLLLKRSSPPDDPSDWRLDIGGEIR